MTAFYKLERTPNPRKDGRKMPYHARFVNQTTTKMEKVINIASAFSSFSSSDIIGVLEVLKKVIILELSYGHNVELKDFAVFTVSLTCPPVYDKRKMNAAHVKFKTIRIRAAADFKNRLERKMRVAKAPVVKKPVYTLEKRKRLLMDHLAQHKYITAKDYRYLTALGRTTAAKELKTFIEEKLIVSRGNGPTTFYMAAD